MVAFTPASVRALIARWGGNVTLRSGLTTCTALAAIVPAAAMQGQSSRPGSYVQRDRETAIIAAVDDTGTALTIEPKEGVKIERGGRTWGIGPTKKIDPDGSGVLCYIAEVTG